MKKNNKKGFTIVELVIVIAVIAILAAVLIPTFSSIIKKAKVNNDIQLVRNLNTALATDNKKHKTMQSALDSAAEFGYDVAKINASATDNEILWDSKNDVFCYLKDGKIEYIPNSVADDDKLSVNSYLLWKISDAVDEIYSTYYTGNATTINTTKGFDAGTTKGITAIEYKNTDTAQEQEVVIRTNSQITDLTINAPLDEVDHYGIAKTVDIKEVKNGTYTENGCVATIKLTKGKVGISKDSIIGKLDLSTAVAEAAVVNNGIVFNVDKGNNTTTTINVSTKPSNEVIEIGTADALINLAAAQNQGMFESALNIKITADIDLTGRTWTPFGDAFDPSANATNNQKKYAFTGSIDGNNHKIVGLSSDGYVGGKSFSIQASSDNGTPFGLITYAVGDITIKNLSIEANVTGNWSGVSAFIGVYSQQYSGNEPDTISFINCVANGSLQGQEKVGGFIGTSYLSLGTDSKCAFVTLEGCINNASITGKKEGTCRIGGLVGTMNADDSRSTQTYNTFKNCVNNGNVIGTKANTAAEFVGATGSGSKQTIKFDNCSGKSEKFVGSFNNAVEASLASSSNNYTGDISNKKD